MNNNRNGVLTLKAPTEEVLNNRKTVIQNLVVPKEGVKYPLVVKDEDLEAVDLKQLCKSYLVLWSIYNTAPLNAVTTLTELNCRFYDLCLRSNVLSKRYIDYLEQGPKTIRRPFHAWIHKNAYDGEHMTNGAEQYAYSGKKVLKGSLPFQENVRARAGELVGSYGYGILACEEMINMERICGKLDSEYRAFCNQLSDNKDTLTGLFRSASIDDAIAARSTDKGKSNSPAE